ncbi:MAG: hypothetical protein AB7O54_11600 [Pseudomonadales bacterium]
MPAKRKQKLAPADQIGAIATVKLSASERAAALGSRGTFLNQFLDAHPEWIQVLEEGASPVDVAALENLFRLVTGEYEIIEEKFPIKNQKGQIIGTRKITKPGPNFQAVRLWLESRGSEPGTRSTSRDKPGAVEALAESKAQVISSILALIHPKPDHPS